MVDNKDFIENCYISIDVEPNLLEVLYSSLSQVLTKLDVPHELSIRPHVSIAYTLGLSNKCKLEKILIDMANAKKEFYFKPIGVVCIEGEAIPKDFIGLKLDTDGDFNFATKYIAEKCPIKLFNGGFIAHISLFQIPKGLFNKEKFLLISKALEAAISDIMIRTNSNNGIKACSISAFNKFRKKEFEFKLN